MPLSSVRAGARSVSDLLRQVPLLSRLDPLVLAEVGRHTVFKAFVPGQVVFRKNDESSDFVVLISGRAQVVNLSEDGRQIGS